MIVTLAAISPQARFNLLRLRYSRATEAPMPIRVVARQDFHAGQSIVVEGPAPEGQYAVVFEDNGETGYFYALDAAIEDEPIQDAVHIYNVDGVADRHLPSTLKIGWALDNAKAVLLINDYAHAIFDFEARRGFCRTGFPPAPSGNRWSVGGHFWDDAAIKLFA
jgi:hypothetical protein